MGMNSGDMIVEVIILVTKSILYRNKNKGKISHIIEVQKKLHDMMISERLIARLENNEQKFLGKWSALYHFLENHHKRFSLPLIPM